MAAPAHQWHPHLRVDDDEDVFGLNEWPSAAADAPWPGLDMEAPRKRRRIAKRLVLLALLFSALAGVAFLVARVARAKAAGVLGLPVGLWSNGGVLTVGKDERFRLKGISWYGMEQNEHCFEGLDKVTMDSILDIVEEHGFNALSVPLAANMYEKNPTIGAECIGTFLNSDLKTLKYRTLLRHFIDKAAKRNLLVMLDLHRVDSNVWPGDGKWEEHEQKILDFWTDLTRQYANQWNVLGADIFNEPYGAKTWESWRKFAEKVGNHIQARAPRWLVVVEGVAMLDSDRKAGLSDVFWGLSSCAILPLSLLVNCIGPVGFHVRMPLMVAFVGHVYLLSIVFWVFFFFFVLRLAPCSCPVLYPPSAWP